MRRHAQCWTTRTARTCGSYLPPTRACVSGCRRPTARRRRPRPPAAPVARGGRSWSAVAARAPKQRMRARRQSLCVRRSGTGVSPAYSSSTAAHSGCMSPGTRSAACCSAPMRPATSRRPHTGCCSSCSARAPRESRSCSSAARHSTTKRPCSTSSRRSSTGTWWSSSPRPRRGTCPTTWWPSATLKRTRSGALSRTPRAARRPRPPSPS